MNAVTAVSVALLLPDVPELPEELWTMVVTFAIDSGHLPTLATVSRVSWHWYRVAQRHPIWKAIRFAHSEGGLVCICIPSCTVHPLRKLILPVQARPTLFLIERNAIGSKKYEDTGHSKTVSTKYVLALGGYNVVGYGTLPNVEEYRLADFASSCTNSDESVIKRSLAPMPLQREGFGYAVHDDQITVFGGCSGSQFPTCVRRYDLRKDTWTTLESNMPYPLAYFASVRIGEDCYLFGGRCNDDLTTPRTLRYNPRRDEFTQLTPPMWGGCLNIAVASPDGQQIYFLNIQQDQHVRIARYDIARDSWEELSQSPWKPKSRSGLAAFWEGYLYLVVFAVATDIERYDPRTNSWEHFAQLPVAPISPAFNSLVSFPAEPVVSI